MMALTMSEIEDESCRLYKLKITNIVDELDRKIENSSTIWPEKFQRFVLNEENIFVSDQFFAEMWNETNDWTKK